MDEIILKFENKINEGGKLRPATKRLDLNSSVLLLRAGQGGKLGPWRYRHSKLAPETYALAQYQAQRERRALVPSNKRNIATKVRKSVKRTVIRTRIGSI
eukprot:IDg7608t1